MSKKNPWKKLAEAQKEAIAKVFADAWLSLPARKGRGKHAAAQNGKERMQCES